VGSYQYQKKVSTWNYKGTFLSGALSPVGLLILLSCFSRR
jgi:hypothetical protein